MIQINAGTRLLASKIDANKACKYLQSLGLELDEPFRTREVSVVFKMTSAEVKGVVDTLTQKLKTAPTKTTEGRVRIYHFNLGPGRNISIESAKPDAFLTLTATNGL